MRIGNTFTSMMMASSSYRAYSSTSPSLQYSPPPSYSTSTPRSSPWHSPVPYLFGGLAAMLGLIAFALLVLACSYWKLSGYLESENNGGEDQGDQSSTGVEIAKMENDNNNRVFEEKFLVIMAGELKPTHLATPSTSRTSSFGSEKPASKTEDDGHDVCRCASADPGR